MTAISQNAPVALDLHLPWEIDKEQEDKFKRILKRLLIPLLLLFLIIPWLPVYELEYEEAESDIVKTKIVLEPVIVEPEPTPEPVATRPPPRPQPQPVAKEKKPKDAKAIAKEEKKKDVAEAQGLTAISSQLNSLRQSLDLTKLQKKNVSTSTGGQIARADQTVLGEDKLTQKSEGIVVDDDMMKNQNVALAMHEATKLDGFVEDGGPDSEIFYSDLRGQRSTESIRRVFEAGKSKAYMFYLRALRDQPDLAGRFVFEVVIEPSGLVSSVKMVSSELDFPDLEKKILNSVKQLKFGAEEVSSKKVQYTFGFLPT